jgi:glycosyltransferase involved in cell wall biosynthesis
LNFIFFISDISSKGGTERISFKVANYLIEHDHSVDFVSWKTSENNLKFYLNPEISICHLSTLSDFNKFSIISNVIKLRRQLTTKKIDVLIDVDSVLTPFSLLAGFVSNTKHVVWEHFNATINLGVKRRDFGRKLAAKYADKCVVLTEEDKKLWEKKFGAKNVTTIYNPVTVDIMPSIVPRKSPRVVLAVGRLSSQKGFDLLLQAWALLKPECKKNTILRIAGSGELESELKNLAIKLQIVDEVDFYGFAADIVSLYREAHCYVLSSRYEGFVLSLTEAMASGLPVISFDCPCGPKELLVNNSGMLVESGNIKQLSAAIENMLNNEKLRDKLAVNALKRSHDFSDNKIMPAWLKLFEELF